MDPRSFCRQSSVVIVAGKGGVGKTTLSATLARMAATHGVDVLVVEVEGRSGVASALGHPDALGYEQTQLVAPDGPGTGAIWARTLTPDDALVEYLVDHGLQRVSRRLRSTGVVDVVATAIPGLRDILVLGKVKALERAGVADLIVVDAPATGHALTFLTSAQGLLDAARVGPIRSQAQDVLELLGDPSRCQLLPVTVAEETPVNEVAETAYALEDRVGVKLGPVVVNGLYPHLEGLEVDLRPPGTERASGADPPALSAALPADQVEVLQDAARFRLGREHLQSEQLQRLAAALPLPQLHLPFLFGASIGPTEVDVLAAALTEQIEGLETVRVESTPADPSREGGST
jgi:anion-transporting  ArsA/GET3 family ATPase